MADFTDKQVFIITRAIRAAREVVKERSPEPIYFLNQFIKSGGIRSPGRELTEDEQRRIGSHILMSINIRPTFMHEPNWVRAIIRRETNRACSEIYLCSSSYCEDITCMRLVVHNNVKDKARCQHFADNIIRDLYRLGSGLAPIDAIIVLPVYCDGAIWEVVFDNEL